MSNIQDSSSELEKAYGGCHKCYGKGYATARIGTSSRYGNVTHDTIIYCTCDRGKQLETVMVNDRQELLKRIEVSIKAKEQHITLGAGSYKEEHLSLVTIDDFQAIINTIRESI